MMGDGDAEERKKRLGKMIVARRIDLGMTSQEDLRQAMGLGSRATVRRFEKGSWTTVHAPNITALEDALLWKRGSWDAVLNGGEPQAIDVPRARVAPRLNEDELIAIYRALPDADPETIHQVRLLLESTKDE